MYSFLSTRRFRFLRCHSCHFTLFDWEYHAGRGHGRIENPMSFWSSLTIWVGWIFRVRDQTFTGRLILIAWLPKVFDSRTAMLLARFALQLERRSRRADTRIDWASPIGFDRDSSDRATASLPQTPLSTPPHLMSDLPVHLIPFFLIRANARLPRCCVAKGIDVAMWGSGIWGR